MKFDRILATLNGFDTPVFGHTLHPSDAEVNVARGVISFLEDRRALYESPEREVSNHLVASVLEIRGSLNDLLKDGKLPGAMAELLKPIRAACRDFMSAAAIDDTKRINLAHQDGTLVLPPKAYFALRGLRETAGFNIGLLAVRYGLDVEEQLDGLISDAFS